MTERFTADLEAVILPEDVLIVQLTMSCLPCTASAQSCGSGGAAARHLQLALQLVLMHGGMTKVPRWFPAESHSIASHALAVKALCKVADPCNSIGKP